MGYETSFHPVPLDLVQERLIPYVLGEGQLDDLVAQAVRLARVRAQAKAWALAAQRLSPAPRRLDPFLHVWGRPFFLVVDDLDALLDVLEQYLAASPEQVDAIAAEQLHALSPGLVDQARAVLTPPALPPEAALRDDLLWRLDILRASVAALRRGQGSVEANGRTHDPRSLLRREVPFTVLHFASALCPGWMSRGTWPTALLDEVPLPSRPFFAPPEALLGRLPREMPSQPWFLYPTLVENYMVGGLVAPSYVLPLRRYIAEHQGALLALRRDTTAQNDVHRELRKIDEALAFAQRKGWAFAEATEVYGGVQALLN